MTAANRPFYSLYSRPTDAQYAAIGRVAVHWSVLEHSLESIMSSLAGAPYFPGLALTNDLSMDNRLKALKTLLDLHRHRYNYRIVPRPLVEALEPIPKAVAKLKSERNVIVHYIWFRWDDDSLNCTRFKAVVPRTARGKDGKITHDDPNFRSFTNQEILSFAAQVETLSDRLYGLSEELEKVDEGAWLGIPGSPTPRRHPPDWR